ALVIHSSVSDCWVRSSACRAIVMTSQSSCSSLLTIALPTIPRCPATHTRFPLSGNLVSPEIGATIAVSGTPVIPFAPFGVVARDGRGHVSCMQLAQFPRYRRAALKVVDGLHQPHRQRFDRLPVELLLRQSDIGATARGIVLRQRPERNL